MRAKAVVTTCFFFREETTRYSLSRWDFPCCFFQKGEFFRENLILDDFRLDTLTCELHETFSEQTRVAGNPTYPLGNS